MRSASLLAATGARHVLVSYNSEGVIADKDLRAILATRRSTVACGGSRDGTSGIAPTAIAKGGATRATRSRELLYYARLR